MRWTRQSIIDEIRRLHKSGEKMNFTSMEANHLSLVRAAAWHFGKWRRAVEEAGIDYESLSVYRRWSKERIIARIQELYAQGKDLSWRAVSTDVDPALAASALRSNGFGTWPEAIEAAGIDINEVSRYKYWNKARVLKAIKSRKKAGKSLASSRVQKEDHSLFCAARRRYDSWDNALKAAGYNPAKIRMRRPPRAASENEKKDEQNATKELVDSAK